MHTLYHFLNLFNVFKLLYRIYGLHIFCYLFSCIFLLFHTHQVKLIIIFYFIQKKLSFKRLFNNKFINRGIKVCRILSLFAGAVCAFFLIPVYRILSGNSATSDDFPTEIKSYFTVLDFLQSHFAALETTIRSSGNDVLPEYLLRCFNLLILVPLFVVNKKIKFRENLHILHFF